MSPGIVFALNFLNNDIVLGLEQSSKYGRFNFGNCDLIPFLDASINVEALENG